MDEVKFKTLNELYERLLPALRSKKKELTNMRSKSSDEALRLTPPLQFTLEEALEFINDDELLEVTPQNLRIRKIELDHGKRLRARGKAMK